MVSAMGTLPLGGMGARPHADRRLPGPPRDRHDRLRLPSPAATRSSRRGGCAWCILTASPAAAESPEGHAPTQPTVCR